MKSKDVQDIFARLNSELDNADGVDTDARQQMRELDDRVSQLGQPQSSDIEFLLDQTKALESRFVAEHPTLARIARELVDALTKMGV